MYFTIVFPRVEAWGYPTQSILIHIVKTIPILPELMFSRSKVLSHRVLSLIVFQVPCFYLAFVYSNGFLRGLPIAFLTLGITVVPLRGLPYTLPFLDILGTLGVPGNILVVGT